MSCVLRVAGELLDLDKMLTAIQIRPYRVWRKGEPDRLGKRVHANSGACFTVSDAAIEDCLEKFREAYAFLEENLQDATKIGSFPGVDSACLDFGVGLSPEQFSQSCTLTLDLLRLAVLASLEIEFTQYAASNPGAES